MPMVGFSLCGWLDGRVKCFVETFRAERSRAKANSSPKLEIDFLCIFLQGSNFVGAFLMTKEAILCSWFTQRITGFIQCWRLSIQKWYKIFENLYLLDEFSDRYNYKCFLQNFKRFSQQNTPISHK